MTIQFSADFLKKGDCITNRFERLPWWLRMFGFSKVFYFEILDGPVDNGANGFTCTVSGDIIEYRWFRWVIKKVEVK